MQEDDLVTIAHLPTVGAAQAARSLLEAAGIPALVQDSDALRLDPFRLGHGVEIRLQVRAEDADDARELLREGELAEDDGDAKDD